MSKKGRVFYSGIFAGIIEELDDYYQFSYAKEYLLNPSASPISLTLPLQTKPYRDSTLFSFFDGLIPEGWFMERVVDNWKINPRDRMALLLASCRETIGAVTVEEWLDE